MLCNHRGERGGCLNGLCMIMGEGEEGCPFYETTK